MSTEPAILKVRDEWLDDRIVAARARQAESIEQTGECPNGCGPLTVHGLNMDCPRCHFRHTRTTIEVPFDPLAHEELERRRVLFELGIGPDGCPLPRYGRPRSR